MALGKQFDNVPHPDSDPEHEGFMNGLGCSEPGCNATFRHPMPRAWHIQRRHPGTYSGPSEDMAFIAGLTGREIPTYTFERNAPRPVEDVDY